MRVSVKTDSGEEADYWLKTIKPGDRLKFSYAVNTESADSTVAAIEGFARKEETYTITPGLRIGLDVARKDGSKPRLSHPPDGGFDFMLGNIPRDHARCFVMAENEEERWNWQLDDLYDGDSIELEIVETDWNTPFPRVEPNNSD